MGTLLRLAADALAALLMALIAVIAWVIVQLGGGGAFLASLLAIPACALMAASIEHAQRRMRRRPPSFRRSARSGDHRGAV
ncbi:hypothetical protein [Streptomyces sp. NPDC050759]|uniref:hypothetical protein n=1 Tax=Streptomyces sp. NPDC050759 TaxID=3365635 RepID=UPI00378A2179